MNMHTCNHVRFTTHFPAFQEIMSCGSCKSAAIKPIIVLRIELNLKTYKIGTQMLALNPYIKHTSRPSLQNPLFVSFICHLYLFPLFVSFICFLYLFPLLIYHATEAEAGSVGTCEAPRYPLRP
jgi:hypothetical protein